MSRCKICDFTSQGGRSPYYVGIVTVTTGDNNTYSSENQHMPQDSDTCNVCSEVAGYALADMQEEEDEKDA